MPNNSKNSQERETLIQLIAKKITDIKLKEGPRFYWSPEEGLLYYNIGELKDAQFKEKLLHEAGHAKLKHFSYSSDLELLRMESDAWLSALGLGSDLNIKIRSQSIKKALASYLDWANARAECPECGHSGLQYSGGSFFCLSCTHKWKVGSSRFKRVYRNSN